MKLFSYIQMFSRFYANNIKLGRWRNTGLSCDIKMANCSHLHWDDYSHASNTTLMNKAKMNREESQEQSNHVGIASTNKTNLV